MEIMSMTMSLDILREATNPQTGLPFFTNKDVDNTQVLILDDHPDGPYFDLWSMYARRPPVRFSAIPPTDSARTNLIVPLAGSSNPFWQAELLSYNCGESVLLRTFSRRVLHFYKVADNSPRSARQLVVTLIDRRGNRRLLHKAEYVDALKTKFPSVLVRLVDFAELEFAEQVRVAHSTDILVGVHGAGLTHGMFLPPNSAVVELQPPNLNHLGFDLMSKSLGHRYYTRHGSEYNSSDKFGDWHYDDMFIEKSDFLDVVSAAIDDTPGSRPSRRGTSR
jgi:protein O-GlcNAc transferase